MGFHVIITTFEPPEGMLARAVASALACPGVDRVTVVDDGSATPVGMRVGEGPVEVLRQSNGGPSSARNMGLDRVRSEWALVLDDDDELLPEGVVSALHAAAELGAIGAVVGRVERAADGSERRREAPKEWAGRALPRAADAFRPIQLFNASGTLIARRAVEQGIRYDTSLRIGEDREFIRRLADLGTIAVAPGVAVRSGVRPGGQRLTSGLHLERRALDHLKIMARWLDRESEAHFRVATRWLLHAMSKAGACDGPAYRGLYQAAMERRWLGPVDRVKIGVRSRLSGGAGRGKTGGSEAK